MPHTPDWYKGQDMSAPCDCGHIAGEHSADHVTTAHCCASRCPCNKSCAEVHRKFYKITDGNNTGDTSIHEKLDFIIAWIHRQELEKMEKDLS